MYDSTAHGATQIPIQRSSDNQHQNGNIGNSSSTILVQVTELRSHLELGSLVQIGRLWLLLLAGTADEILFCELQRRAFSYTILFYGNAAIAKMTERGPGHLHRPSLNTIGLRHDLRNTVHRLLFTVQIYQRSYIPVAHSLAP